MSVMKMIRNQNHEKKKSMDHETHTQIRLESKDLLEVNPRKHQGERSWSPSLFLSRTVGTYTTRGGFGGVAQIFYSWEKEYHDPQPPYQHVAILPFRLDNQYKSLSIFLSVPGNLEENDHHRKKKKKETNTCW